MNRHRWYSSMMALAIVTAAAGVGIRVYTGTTSAQDSTALKTPWGDPDLQGIWTDETDTPLQRPTKYANQEIFTPEQRAELDKERAAALGRDKRGPKGSELDVLGAYNAEFSSIKHTGVRTSLVVDPRDGRLPPMTPEARKILAADREFRLALMQATVTCKQQLPGCRGGKYDPRPTARRNELPPRYNTARMNRHDNPEDGALADRCLTGGLPEFGSLNGGSFRRIVQTPGGITMYYDVGQGQGWQRNIIMNGSAHLPASIRQWFGDSRGHWEGNTLVIDVTNFSPETDYRGSRENLHLIERWTRTGPKTLSYEVTVEDPTVWTGPWTARQEFTQQSNEENRIYYEPRCWEGDYGFPTIMRNARLEDEAFAKGKGPDPLTEDQASGFGGDDPLQNGGE